MGRIVSIIIPAFNEAKYIKDLISKINKINFSKINLKHEIIVVDDGSEDNTFEILSEIQGIKVIKQKNLGKGRAVQKGIELSCGDLILIQDADLEYDPEDFYINYLNLSNLKKKIVFMAVDQ